MGSNRRFNVLVGVLACASACALAYSFLESSTREFTVLLSGSAVVLALLAIVAEQLAVRFADKLTVTASNLPILLAIMFLGRTSAMVVGGFVGLWGCWRENAVATAVFNSANFVFPVFLGGTAFMALQSGLGFSIHSVSLELLGCGALAGLVYEIANLALVGAAAKLKYERGIRSFWREEMPPFLRSLAILALLGLAVAALYAQVGHRRGVLLFIPLLASQYMFSFSFASGRISPGRKSSQRPVPRDEHRAGGGHGRASRQQGRIHGPALSGRSHVLSGHRPPTRLAGERRRGAAPAGLLHDLGKVGVPDGCCARPCLD